MIWKSLKHLVWRRKREPFFEQNPLLLTICVFLIVLGASEFMADKWMFKAPGAHIQDILDRSIPATDARAVRLVMINSEEYEKHFKNGIDPESLTRVIESIRAYHPAVIAVDLDTSARRFNKMNEPSGAPPIVWARDVADFSREDLSDSSSSRRDSKSDDHGEHLLPALGRDNPRNWGLALFPLNPDWTVRTYQRSFPVDNSERPSFHWAIACAYWYGGSSEGYAKCLERKEYPTKKATSEDISVGIQHSRFKIPKIPLSEILLPEGAKHQPRVADSNPLNGKIAIVGGSFSPGDVHTTAFGDMNGVELVATAVEAELTPPSQFEISTTVSVLIDLAIALLFITLYRFLTPVAALLASSICLALMFFGGPVVALIFAGYRMNAVAFSIGMIIEQLWRGAEGAERAELRLEKALHHQRNRSKSESAAV